MCYIEGCTRKSNYNFKYETKGLYCNIHKLTRMININDKRICAEKDCIIGATYNYEGESVRLYCSKHAKDNMIDVLHKKCNEPKCRLLPSYNFETEKAGLYCKTHMKDGMIYMSSKICGYIGCVKQACFNYENENKAIYCKSHADDKMVDVKNRTCKEIDCNIQPHFNYEGQKSGIYCSKHAKDGMICVTSAVCIYKDCGNRAHFSHVNETKRLYCKMHALDGMINNSHKICTGPNCETRASYGIPGHHPSCCSKHKSIEMIKHSSKKCKFPKCKLIAIFGQLTNKNAIHCNIHKDPTEINLIERPCKSCGLEYILNLNNLCIYCEPEAIQRVRKIKENEIKVLLDNNNIRYDCYDKIIPGGCDRKRPDFLFDCGSHFVNLEVDEHQHKAEMYSCECVRIFNIVNSLGIPVIFLRYNPDSFKQLNGKKSEIIKGKRHDILLKSLKASFILPPKNESEFIRIKYLFYDGWIETDTEYEKILYVHNVSTNSEDKIIADIKGKGPKIIIQEDLKNTEISSDNPIISDSQNIITKQHNEIDVDKLRNSTERRGYLAEELKKFCKDMEITVRGTKKELVKRILDKLGL